MGDIIAQVAIFSIRPMLTKRILLSQHGRGLTDEAGLLSNGAGDGINVSVHFLAIFSTIT
jgi:hypothetical protein